MVVEPHLVEVAVVEEEEAVALLMVEVVVVQVVPEVGVVEFLLEVGVEGHQHHQHLPVLMEYPPNNKKFVTFQSEHEHISAGDKHGTFIIDL